MGNIQEIKHTVGSDPSKNWTRGYVYDESTNKLLKHDSAQTLDDYTYDAHGNITSMPHLTLMEWDHEDMLIKSTKGTESTYYRYDATGERVRKITVKQNGDKNERLYFGNYEIYREIENGNDETNPKKERQTVHISDDTTRIAMVEKLTTENGSAVSNPVEVVRYQLNNHLGSASVELNENADIISYEEYHPFGTTSYQKHNTDISQKRYKYVGKECDEETGLYNYGFRLYAPWIGRFISTDPMAGERTWVNPYNYCQNNPINRTDPTGALDTGDDPPVKTKKNKSKDQKVFFQNNLKNDDAFQRIYFVQRNTSLGEKFSDELQNQEKYNVLYFSFEYYGTEGRVKEITNIEQFKKTKERQRGLYSDLSIEDVENAMSDGKSVVLIGILYQRDNKSGIYDGALTLNHEEGAHALEIIEDGLENRSSNDDHEFYYGNPPKSNGISPNDHEILKLDKYKNSPARKNYLEIEEIVNRLFYKPPGKMDDIKNQY